MPRQTTAGKTNIQRVQDYAREHPGLTFDELYHIIEAAVIADGKPVRGDPNAPALTELSPDAQGRVNAAKRELGLS